MVADRVVQRRSERRGLLRRRWKGGSSIVRGGEVVVVTGFVDCDGPAAVDDELYWNWDADGS